jgi:hypothetical protein
MNVLRYFFNQKNLRKSVKFAGTILYNFPLIGQIDADKIILFYHQRIKKRLLIR